MQDILQRMKATLDQCHRSLPAYARNAMPFGDTQKIQCACGYAPPYSAGKEIDLITDRLCASDLGHRGYQMKAVYDPGNVAGQSLNHAGGHARLVRDAPLNFSADIQGNRLRALRGSQI